MNDSIIKESLAYSLASELHEAWREQRKKDDGTYEPRIKTSNDEEWNEAHNTNQVDIANTAFKDLPVNWQYENLEAARVVISLVYDFVLDNRIFSKIEIEQMAEIIHNEWLKRNSWVYDKTYGNSDLAVSYSELSKEEQDKDKAQIYRGIYKVYDYLNGLVDVNFLCKQYRLSKRIK